MAHTIAVSHVRTLIFDLDGTLSDPFVGISRSVNFALAASGFATVEPHRIRPLIGPPLQEIFECLAGPLQDNQQEVLVAKYRERYASVGYAENQLYKDIPETLAALSQRDFRLGVCTSKRVDYGSAIVAMFELSAHFDFVDGGGDGVSKTQQLRRLIDGGVDPDTAVMIGDRRFDIDAANKNRVQSVGVSWGFAADDELELAGAGAIVNSPNELLGLFT